MADIFLKSILSMDCVYWPALGQNPDGTTDYDDPVQVPCLWIDEQILYINQNAEETVSKCTVLVDRDLTIGGMLWLGLLQDLVDQDEPSNNVGANIINAFGKYPIPRAAKKFVRRAIC